MYRTVAQLDSVMNILSLFFPQVCTRVELPNRSIEGRHAVEGLMPDLNVMMACRRLPSGNARLGNNVHGVWPESGQFETRIDQTDRIRSRTQTNRRYTH